MKYFETIIKM